MGELKNMISIYLLSGGEWSYQQHVARPAPVIKKWKSNTEITTKTACPALWSYLKGK
jgi:hypothetical protein